MVFSTLYICKHALCFPGMGLKPAPDELVLGQVRDWNEELQTARELPSDTVTNKIFRERSLYKVNTAVTLLISV